MKYAIESVGGTVTILASPYYLSIPAKLTGTDPVKAGMPIDKDGAAAKAGTGAVGILLYDVDPKDNPNCALVVNGIVDWKKCQDHSGATATAATMKGILPAITFRENIGVNTTADDDDGDDGDDSGKETE